MSLTDYQKKNSRAHTHTTDQLIDPATGDVAVVGGSHPNLATHDALGLATDAEVAALSSVYQPLDSDLTAIAALSTTSFGRSLLAQASASATRSTLVAAGAMVITEGLMTGSDMTATTTPTDVPGCTITAVPTVAEDWTIDCWCLMSLASADGFPARVKILYDGGTPSGGSNPGIDVASINGRMMMHYSSLAPGVPAGSHTVKLQFSKDGGSAVYKILQSSDTKIRLTRRVL